MALAKQYGAARPATAAERPVYGPEVIDVPPAAMADFRRELDALADVTITIAQAPVTLENVGQMSAADLIALGPLVAAPD